MSFWKRRRVLITGGAGFIGSHLVEDLIKEGAIVSVADNLIRGNINNIKSVSKDIIMYIVDLRNYENCVKVSKNQEIIVNLAGEEPNCEYAKMYRRRIFEDNILLQVQILKAAYENKVDRFLQISSCKADLSKEELDLYSGQACVCKNDNSIGLAKRVGEEIARYYSLDTGMKVGIARLFGVYGARDNFDKESSHLVAGLVKKVIDNEDPIIVWGSGERKRIYVNVYDVIKCLKLIIEKIEEPVVIEIGHNKPIMISELVEKIKDIVGAKNSVIYDENKGSKKTERIAKIDKLIELTGGFVPSSELDKGLLEVINYYKEIKYIGKEECIDLESYYEGE